MAYGYFRGYGQVSSTLDANGLTTSRQIDPFGREIHATDVNGISVNSHSLMTPSRTGWITSDTIT